MSSINSPDPNSKVNQPRHHKRRGRSTQKVKRGKIPPSKGTWSGSELLVQKIKKKDFAKKPETKPSLDSDEETLTTFTSSASSRLSGDFSSTESSESEKGSVANLNLNKISKKPKSQQFRNELIRSRSARILKFGKDIESKMQPSKPVKSFLEKRKNGFYEKIDTVEYSNIDFNSKEGKKIEKIEKRLMEQAIEEIQLEEKQAFENMNDAEKEQELENQRRMKESPSKSKDQNL